MAGGRGEPSDPQPVLVNPFTGASGNSHRGGDQPECEEREPDQACIGEQSQWQAVGVAQVSIRLPIAEVGELIAAGSGAYQRVFLELVPGDAP